MSEQYDDVLGEFILDSAICDELGIDTETIKLEEDYREWLREIQVVAGTEEGKSLICKLLLKLGTFEPAYCGNSNIYRATALKDFGNELLTDIATVSPTLNADIHWRVRTKLNLDERLKIKKG